MSYARDAIPLFYVFGLPVLCYIMPWSASGEGSIQYFINTANSLFGEYYSIRYESAISVSVMTAKFFAISFFFFHYTAFFWGIVAVFTVKIKSKVGFLRVLGALSMLLFMYYLTFVLLRHETITTSSRNGTLLVGMLYPGFGGVTCWLVGLTTAFIGQYARELHSLKDED